MWAAPERVHQIVLRCPQWTLDPVPLCVVRAHHVNVEVQPFLFPYVGEFAPPAPAILVLRAGVVHEEVLLALLAGVPVLTATAAFP